MADSLGVVDGSPVGACFDSGDVGLGRGVAAEAAVCLLVVVDGLECSQLLLWFAQGVGGGCGGERISRRVFSPRVPATPFLEAGEETVNVGSAEPMSSRCRGDSEALVNNR